MKKYIVGALVGLVMLAPVSVANAASNLSPMQVSLITQLIALLEFELQQLLMEQTTPAAGATALPSDSSVASDTVPAGTLGQSDATFTVTPQITTDADNAQMLNVHWETNIPVSASAFYLKQHPTDAGVLQQSFNSTTTAFDYQAAKYSTPTFYEVTITGSDGSVQSFSGQLSANQ
jgi:hypothetical protein